MSISQECQNVLEQITTADHDAKQALQQLQAATPAETVNLLQQYRAVTKKLHDLQESLTVCHADSYQLEATLRGTATFNIQSLAQGSSDVSYLILLNKRRTVITLSSFPPISLTIHIAGADDIATITQTSGGSGTYANGNISLPLGLHLTNSVPIAGSSDVSITLTTDPPGSPVNPRTFGPVTLVGSGIIQGGLIGGRRCDMTIAGSISVIET